MKKLGVFAVFAGLLMFAVAPQVRADHECSLADLQGVYSFVASGTVTGSNDAELPVGPFAAVGRGIYDGKGNVTGVIQANLNGAPVYDTWTATYSVDRATCTFTKIVTLTKGPTLTFFITAGDDFKELRFITTDGGTVITGTAKKQ